MRHLQTLVTALLAITVIAAPHGPPTTEVETPEVESPFPHHDHYQNHGHDHGHYGKPPAPPPKTEKRKFGISYSPYNTGGTCKSQEEVNADIDRLVSSSSSSSPDSEESDYGFIRIYGIDCDQTARVATAAKRQGMRVFAGIFDLSDFPHSLDSIISVAHSHTENPENQEGEGGNGKGNGWDIFHTISIGNELVQTHQSTVPEVVSALHQARTILRSAGYGGPVVTVDTYTMLLEHPELCAASDYCAANCHVFFDATQTPDMAGDYAMDVARRISNGTVGGEEEGGRGERKRTVIAESGWPHDGLANGRAVPSGENQRVAVESLRMIFGGVEEKDDDAGLVLFTAFDDLWKVDNEGTFGAEKFWGINR